MPRITRARPPRKPKPVAVCVSHAPKRERQRVLPIADETQRPVIVKARSPAEIKRAKRIEKLRERGA